MPPGARQHDSPIRLALSPRFGQNGPVSQWAGIESGVPASRAALPTTTAARTRVVPRLRRTERLIVGSIDGAAHLMQRRARDVLLGSAVIGVPMMALNVLLTIVAFNRFDTFDTVLGDRGYVGAQSGFILVALAVQSLTAHLVGAYCATFLVRYQMGGNPRMRECWLAVLKRLPMLILTWVLTHWWAVLLDLWIITSDVAGLVVLFWLAPLVAALLGTCVLLVTPVMMGEKLGLRAIGRAFRLIRTRFGAGFGFMFACGLLSVLLFSFIAFLPALAKSTGLITFGPYTWLVQGISSQLALLVVVPFSAIATAQLYLQVRVHAEGLDITLAADRAFGATS